MYNLNIPTVVNAPAYNRENVLSELRRAGASRVLLAIGALEYGSDLNNRNLEILRKDIPYFQKNGFEVGVWFWGLMVTGNAPFVHISDFAGKERESFMCPSDEGFVSFMQDFVRKVASLSPHLLLLDDDMRFGYLGEGFGCTCKNHLRMMSEELCEEITYDGLYDKMFSGKPNKYRSAFISSCGRSLENYCIRLREAVDSVNPEVRLGLCACISNYDADGTDAFKMAKLLAGTTKPYLRLIGAPYWGAARAWGHRISDVVEFERMQRSWYDGDDIEIVSEGDTWPRPRYKVPSSYLEIFDTALRASGEFSGIQKYMIDYNSSTDYEREYITRHNANKVLYRDIERIFSKKHPVGVRIYEARKKLENADFTDRKHTVSTIPDMAFSRAIRFTSENSIASVHKGQGVCGISFGENIRSFIGDSTVFEKPLAIDLPAARILVESGVDVGITAFLGEASSRLEHFHRENEYAPSSPIIEKTVLQEKANLLSSFILEDKSEIPAAFTYRNAEGMSFLVYTFDAQLSDETVIRTYARQKQFTSAMQSLGVTFPAIIPDCPDLYIIAKKDENGNMAIGLWNCFADAVYDKYICFDGKYSNAEIINADIVHCGDKALIKKLGAFEFCFISLTK